MFHLTARVAWHDSRWNSSVCRQPSCISFCAALDRIREKRDGVLSRHDYKRGWDWKRASQKNGFAEGKTLVTSTEEDGKGLDSVELKKVALVIKGLLE